MIPSIVLTYIANVVALLLLVPRPDPGGVRISVRTIPLQVVSFMLIGLPFVLTAVFWILQKPKEEIEDTEDVFENGNIKLSSD
ncbi:MAG: hypothetical protein ACXAEN_22700 [Candidatus Thorarchaeota archaeon]